MAARGHGQNQNLWPLLCCLLPCSCNGSRSEVVGAHPNRYDPFVADRGPIVTEIKRAGVFWPAEVRGNKGEKEGWVVR
jgi:hypothetical protein